MNNPPIWIKATINTWYPNKRKKRVFKPLLVHKCTQCGNDLLRKRRLCFTCIQSNTLAKDAIRRSKYKQLEREPINKITVFDRDKWKCKMCKVSTPVRLMGTMNKNAPTLDHIVPLSKGGSHTYNHVQLLCRHCNCSVKRDLLINSQ